MHEPLIRDITWLNDRLAEVAAAPSDDTAAATNIASVVTAMLDSGELDPQLAELDDAAIHTLLKRLTIRFHLRNKAEQIHIVRINREREQQATAANPRPT